MLIATSTTLPRHFHYKIFYWHQVNSHAAAPSLEQRCRGYVVGTRLGTKSQWGQKIWKLFIIYFLIFINNSYRYLYVFLSFYTFKTFIFFRHFRHYSKKERKGNRRRRPYMVTKSGPFVPGLLKSVQVLQDSSLSINVGIQGSSLS